MMAAMQGDSNFGSEQDKESPNHETCITAIGDQGGNNLADGTMKKNRTSNLCLIAKKDVFTKHKVNLEQIREDIHHYDKETCLNVLIFCQMNDLN